MKRIGVFAGGAARGAEPVGKLTTLRKEYDTYIGTSTGALIALFMALGRIDSRFYDLLLYEYQNTTNREMYGWFQPYFNGKINKIKMVSAFANMVRKDSNYIYDISPGLHKKLERHFDESHFEQLRSQKIDVIVTNKNVDLKRSKTEYTSILQKGMNFERFKSRVVASASIPFFAKPTLINNFQYVDGGVLDPIPTAKLSGYVGCEIDIWLCHSEQEEQSVLNPASSWKELAANLFNDMRYEIKMDDLNTVKNDCTIYYSRFYDWDSSNFDPKNMREAIKHGQHAAKNLKGVKL
jgi:predicted acylesterase/phospholipase RssA